MQEIKLPWGAWYSEDPKLLIFPDFWNVEVIGPPYYASYNVENIDAHIHEFVSILSKKIAISEIKNGIGIGIDDLTRPTPAAEIITKIIKALKDINIPPEKLHLYIATGSHRIFQKQDYLKKIGKLAYQECTIHHHSPYCNVSYLGETSLKTPIYVNSSFVQMDFKLVIGTVLPHSSVGFSGGIKLVVPGLAGIETIKSLHRSSPDRKGKFADIEDNPLRADINEAGKYIGVDFFIQIVCNPDRSIANIFSGEDILTYSKAIQYLKEKATFFIKKSYDIVICNAYPLDSEFVQSGKALDVIRVTKNEIVKNKGTIILSTAASEGQGFHGLRSPDMIEPFSGDWTESYENRELVFFGENISPLMLPEETRVRTKVFNQWNELLSFLEKKYDHPEICIIPYASIQIPIYQKED
ncbi:MAG: hypothetical protein A2941_00340 [Candidatus Yanofskybacteria bacterium RIFCSPLOWO2_01_FULL_49_17]|uniref:LarA-like N-terminal domain-containing protein n=1 Tax=Candidatus Yanofskybacteria bacterium RIFCSPLOWO2_01_FULL_49_17 TaxID=1802700 RepID=A0A1F8GPJ5_9BACT|nr:MAG: hypothetical protein A2941_00340 [Candidatus Yanofskybacteria bacterium RIFCSPLOWO2_01_FULL_49_17]